MEIGLVTLFILEEKGNFSASGNSEAFLNVRSTDRFMTLVRTELHGHHRLGQTWVSCLGDIY